MTTLPEPHQTVHFTFDTFLAATEALLVVLVDARTTERTYSFTGVSPSRILRSGLTLQGDVVDIVKRVTLISGARSA